jgi:hypothetical protein
MCRNLEGSGWGQTEVPSWHMVAGSEDNYVKPASIVAVWPVFIWVIPALDPECCRYTKMLGKFLHFKTTITSENYDRPKTTRECGIY